MSSMKLNPAMCLLPVLAACGASSRPTYVEPPAKVALEVVPGVATVTWEPGLNAKTVVLTRTTADEAVVAPDGGQAVGDLLGRGVVLYEGDGARFVDSNLPDSCGPFSWHAWSRAADGTFASAPATARSLRGEHTIAPSAVVTGLVSAFEGSVLRLRWVSPDASTGFLGVKVVRKLGSAPARADDGITVYSGGAETFTEPASALSPTQATHYAVFNCNGCGKCGPSAPSLAVPPAGDGGTNLGLTGLDAQLDLDAGVIALSWSSSAPTVKVLRRVGTPPASVSDPSATVVFEGPGTRASEPIAALTPDLPLRPNAYVYAAWACVGALCGAAPATKPFILSLRQALRGGGYTVFLHHATAGVCADRTTLGTASTTSAPDWWKSCDATCGSATAEQLAPTASASELTELRTFFSTSGVRAGRVLSSEFCRAVRTAEGLQLGPVIEQVPALTYFVYDEANRCRDTRALLNAPPGAGTNTVLISHANFAASCPVLETLGPAEALVYKPQLGAPALFLARLSPAQWAALP